MWWHEDSTCAPHRQVERPFANLERLAFMKKPGASPAPPPLKLEASEGKEEDGREGRVELVVVGKESQ